MARRRHLPGALPDYSAAGTAELVAVLRAVADRADATDATTTADRNLVEAVAFSARSDATLLGTHATLTAINPSEGLVAAMLVFLPRYPLGDPPTTGPDTTPSCARSRIRRWLV